MKIINNIFRSIVYHCTEKPAYYVHVDRPKTLQEHRQVQYNNWCKAKAVYNGSYLPKIPDTLKNKGWTEMTTPSDKTGMHRTFRRKSSGQVVDFHYKYKRKNGVIANEHYHWWNVFPRKSRSIDAKNTQYRDRYGNVCKDGSPESHLAPLDKKYDYK